jgi:hypothetical protein
MCKQDKQVLVFIFCYLLIVLSYFYFVPSIENVHHCEDRTHQQCDGFCTCDGLGCN